MRYRPLDAAGDYTVGLPFLVDSPDAVAQAILTRLKLWSGEWFVDTTDGTPYLDQILGKSGNPDSAIQQRILATPGVTSITAYDSSRDPVTRALSVTATVQTQYGTTTLTANL